MEHRHSLPSYFQRNPPYLREIDRLLGQLRNGTTPATCDTKQPPTCAEICLLASLAGTIASIRDRAPSERGIVHQRKLIDAASGLMELPIDWNQCPVDFDVDKLLGALRALMESGLSFNPYSDLHAEWLELERVGVPLFEIVVKGDGSLWGNDHGRLPPAKQ